MHQTYARLPIAFAPLATAGPWDLVATGYAAEWMPRIQPFAREALQLARLSPSARVLDIAAGPGTLTLPALESGLDVSAIDISSTMLGILRRTADAAGHTRLDARVGDGQALPFPDAAFDGAFALFGIGHFANPAAGFGELHRVLRPGARAVVADLRGAFGDAPLAETLSASLGIGVKP